MPKAPHTRHFRFESEMAAPVIQWLQRNRLGVKSEFKTPWGICDFVGVRFRPKRVRVRLSYGQRLAIGPPLRLQILSEIPDAEVGEPIALHRLSAGAFLSVPPDRLQNELDHLIKGKFVRSPRPNYFEKINGWFPLHERIVAVELKLSKVAEAAAQARSNLAFATESYIALPMDRALLLACHPRKKQIARSGVGLLGVSSTRCILLFWGKKTAEFTDEILQAHCVERFWRTRGSSS